MISDSGLVFWGHPVDTIQLQFTWFNKPRRLNSVKMTWKTWQITRKMTR